MPVCAKMIFSWVRQVLGIAEGHVFRYSLRCYGTVALVDGVTVVSLLQQDDWARVSTPGRHCFSTYITTTDWQQGSVPAPVLGLSE